MPGTLRIVVKRAKNLPVMNKVTKQSDAYAVIHMGDQSGRTHVCPKTLDPRWDASFLFKVSDEDLHEPLIVKLWDQDILSSDDPIGQVTVEVNSLTKWTSPAEHKISGWLPIYDTMKGNRGQLELSIALESFFPNVGRFRDTSPRVPCFSVTSIPENYQPLAMRGFVEELIKCDDPEYQWVDVIRTARSSNEARQALFKKLAGELQRKIGVKAVEAGCNAVLGFKLNFDLEGDSGMVARGIGTAVLLEQENTFGPLNQWSKRFVSRSQSAESGEPPDSDSPGSTPCLHPRELAQDAKLMACEPVLPLITLTQMPQYSVKRLGGVVTARAVKLLKHLEDAGGLDETEGRDEWWNELREEVRGHAKSLGCNSVIGYYEVTSICESQDICLLSSTGTAAVVDFPGFPSVSSLLGSKLSASGNSTSRITPTSRSSGEGLKETRSSKDFPCSIFHCPFDVESSNGMRAARCSFCNREGCFVPEILFSTTDPSSDLPVVGASVMIHAQVCRTRERKGKSKQDAAILVGEYIPFLEYDLYQQLINKMRINSVNALFGLRVQITVGETLLTAVALATATCAPALPMISRLNWQNFNIPSDNATAKTVQRIKLASDNSRSTMEKSIREFKATSWYKAVMEGIEGGGGNGGDSSPLQPHFGVDSKESTPIMIGGEKLTFGLEALRLLDPLRSPQRHSGLWICSTETIPGLEAEYGCLREQSEGMTMITSIKRVSLGTKDFDFNTDVSGIFTELLEQLHFKLRSMAPGKLCNLRLDVGLPCGENVAQLVINAMVVSLRKKEGVLKTREDDSQVYITPMNHVPGCRTVHHLGYIFIPIIKESASLTQRGGMNNFTHVFLSEALGLARAQVASMGGDALVGFRLRRFSNSHTSRTGQGVLQVSGDCISTTKATTGGSGGVLGGGGGSLSFNTNNEIFLHSSPRPNPKIPVLKWPGVWRTRKLDSNIELQD